MYLQVTTCGKTNIFHNVCNETSTYRFDKKITAIIIVAVIIEKTSTIIRYIYMRWNAVSITI